MRLTLPLVLSLSLSCSLHSQDIPDNALDSDVSSDLETAPPASPRIESERVASTSTTIDSYFGRTGSQRIHTQLDRPMYKPGDDIWVKTWSVNTRGLTGNGQPQITYELVNPRGNVVETKQVMQQAGTATNDFILSAEAPGGLWKVRSTLPSGEIDERPFVVASYEAPRIRKELEFVREAYGPGDRVDALVELERGSGGPLAQHEVRALLQVAGETILEKTLTTDDTGAVLVSAQLPRNLQSSDGLLTVLVDDGGITESISRSVPIVLADLQLSFFPEGGDLVEDLPGRVYFESTNQHGEPADVSGYIADDSGRKVTSFTSLHDGLGRFSFTPKAGQTYTAHVTSPIGLRDGIALPEAQPAGCTLRAFDDVHSAQEEVRVAVRCSSTRDVLISGILRETVMDAAVVSAGPKRDAVVYLEPGEGQADKQGAVRITVFDTDRNPLAERLVYRNHGQNLNIDIKPDRETYGPRDEVVLTVHTTDPGGEPLSAEVALSVVDDAVIGLADDKEGHMLTRLYLEPELVDSPKDPGWYFDRDEALAARGMDLVMGTKGYRRFEWKAVWNPPVPETTAIATRAPIPDRVEFDFAEAPMEMEAEDVLMERPAPPPKASVRENKQAKKDLRAEKKEAPRDRARADPAAGAPERRMDKVAMAHGGMAMEDFDDIMGEIGYVDEPEIYRPAFAAVRVFPKPDYSAGFTGTRTDFRDTVHWEPKLTTDADGHAEVRFYLSDAVATFRVTSEGLSSGYAGHEEATFRSVLPVSISTKLPAAVSAGDRLLLPLIVSNTRDQALSVGLSGHIDSQLVTLGESQGMLQLPPGEGETFWMPAEIGQGSETAKIRLQAEGGGLYDSVERELKIVPPGFPRSWSAAGEAEALAERSFQLDEVIPGSLTATAVWHPSPVSNLITGMEGLIREPGGCFEQTSSTNWPNVAILNYLESHEGDPRLVVQSQRALESGYAKLTGYQVEAGGFETWGSGPGKEVLSAFGLLQFHDMQQVYPVAGAILSKDVDYLLAQRTGKGGYANSGDSAHGYGSAPAPVLDGFITYALVTTGHDDGLKTEIAHQATAAETSEDPYVLALATRTLLVTEHPGAKAAVKRLAAIQADDGSFPGAESSITRSYEANLLVESTALAALALMESGTHREGADDAASWLIENRRGPGTWGATQATALALGALTTHAEISKRPRSSGELFLEVNGEQVASLAYGADQSDPLVLDGWEDALRTGDNDIVLRHAGGEPLPFTVEVAWTSMRPETSPGAELSVQTTLGTDEAAMGDTVRLTATVDNRTERIVPSPIARIGIPAGLEAQTWQLKQLQDRGEVAFFETREREVTLYWDGLHPDAEHVVHLDLVATVPGSFTGPASSAYPYYNDDEKAWDDGLTIDISRP